MRPRRLADYMGQSQAKAQLFPALMAAKKGKALGHLLLYGPAGTGKTTLAELLGGELGTKMVKLDARSIKTVEDFAIPVMQLNHNDILFIDEIHGLDKELEEIFYRITDDFVYRVKVGKEWVDMPLKRFILVGATTKPSEITAPLLSRFTMRVKLVNYTVEELTTMAQNICVREDYIISEEAAAMLGRVSRGVARTLEKNLQYTQFVAEMYDTQCITEQVVSDSLKRLRIDDYGLNDTDRELLRVLRDTYKNQPTGLKALAASLNETEDNLESFIEPYLIRIGLLIRTARGRVLSARGLEVAGNEYKDWGATAA